MPDLIGHLLRIPHHPIHQIPPLRIDRIHKLILPLPLEVLQLLLSCDSLFYIWKYLKINEFVAIVSISKRCPSVLSMFRRTAHKTDL